MEEGTLSFYPGRGRRTRPAGTVLRSREASWANAARKRPERTPQGGSLPGKEEW